MSVGRLPDEERSLWQALSPRAESWVAELAGPPQSPVVVIDHAHRSQFADLLDALGAGRTFPDGCAAVALRGHRFKGQRDRQWVALDGNLHLCVHYRPSREVARLGAGCTVLPAVAATEAIRGVCAPGIDVGIKWVNDVLIAGRKVGGVLTGTQTRGAVVEHVVFGVGLNVAATPAFEAAPFGPAPGCLRELGAPPDLTVADVLTPLLSRIDWWYRRLTDDGPDPLLDAYRAGSCVVGRNVEVWADQGVSNGAPSGPLLAAGRVETIEADLGLRIAGRPEVVRTGRLRFAPDT